MRCNHTDGVLVEVAGVLRCAECYQHQRRCRTDHDRAVADDATWAEWIRVGVQAPMVDGDPALDLRNCPACATTRAREVTP